MVLFTKKSQNQQVAWILITLIVCMSLTFAGGKQYGNYLANSSPTNHGPNPPQCSASRGIINIQSDADFTTANGVVSGDGSESNPFLITNWEISCLYTDTGILINNSNMYFTVSNCHFQSGFICIRIQNSNHGTVENNVFENVLGVNAVQTPTDDTYGANALDFWGLYGKDSPNLIVRENTFHNISTGWGGPGGNGVADSGGKTGGEAGDIFPIYLNNCDNAIIMNNFIEDLHMGRGGNGGNGRNAGSTGAGGTGAYAGNAGLAYGIYITDSDASQISKNIIANITGHFGGNGGYGGNGGTTSGNGGSAGLGRQGSSAYGIIIDTSDSVLIENNSISSLHGSDGGTGGIGGDAYTGTTGNGGKGGYGGHYFGIRFEDSEECICTGNILYSSYAGNGGFGAAYGDVINSGSSGLGGAGGNSGYSESIYTTGCKRLLIYGNCFYQSYGGMPGMGAGGAADGDVEPPYAFYLSTSSLCEFLYNDVYSQLSHGAANNYYDDGHYGNYWYYYTGPDQDPRDGVGDTLFTFSDNNYNDTCPLIYSVFEDNDGDGLTNVEELMTYKTDFLDTDTDDDLIPDGWEVQYNLDPTNPADANVDLDGDGLTNYMEYYYGYDPSKYDSDGDGLSDLDEVQGKTLPPPNNATDNGNSTSGMVGFFNLIEQYQTTAIVLMILISVIIHGFIVRPKHLRKIPDNLPKEVSPIAGSETESDTKEIDDSAGKK